MVIPSCAQQEMVKGPDLTATDTSAWLPYGAANLTKIRDGGAPALKIETLRRGSPNNQCGVRGEVGAVAAGDLLRVEITYRIIKGGGVTMMMGVNMNVGLAGLASEKDESLAVDVPVKIAGNWSFWLLQSMNQRRGEIILKKLSVHVAEHGDPARFPAVVDGDMEQMSSAFFGAYNKARLSKDEQVVRSGKRSLHAVSYDDDRPGSMYAGVACNFGPFDAKTHLKVSFDIKVATGMIIPMMTRGAFDKGYDSIGPGDWKHVELDYETPLNSWYSIIWTRTTDEPFEFWLDNVVCRVENK